MHYISAQKCILFVCLFVCLLASLFMYNTFYSEFPNNYAGGHNSCTLYTTRAVFIQPLLTGDAVRKLYFICSYLHNRIHISKFLLRENEWENIEIWGSWRGGRIPISQPKFWLNPIVPEHKSHHLSGCPAQILIPFPFSIVFLLMNPSPSAWNPIFPPKNKQIPVPILPLQDPQIY